MFAIFQHSTSILLTSKYWFSALWHRARWSVRLLRVGTSPVTFVSSMMRSSRAMPAIKNLHNKWKNHEINYRKVACTKCNICCIYCHRHIRAFITTRLDFKICKLDIKAQVPLNSRKGGQSFFYFRLGYYMILSKESHMFGMNKAI